CKHCPSDTFNDTLKFHKNCAWIVRGWAILGNFAPILTDGKQRAVLARLAALLCLLSPVFESGRVLVAPPSEPYARPSPDLSMLLLAQVSSLLACAVWESGVCAYGKKEKCNNDQDAKQLLLRMLKYFIPDTLYIVAAFSFLIFTVICESLIPLYQGKVIDMLKGDALESSFSYVIGQLALVSLGSSLFASLRGGLFMCILSRLNRRLKHKVFHNLLWHDVHFFEKNDPGEDLSSRLQRDVDKMGRTVAFNANAMVRSLVRTCLMFGVMLNLSWELTVLTCIEMPLMAVIQNTYIRLKKQIQDCHAKTEGLALQTLKWIRIVRSFKAEDDEARRYNEAVDEMRAVKIRSGTYSYIYGLTRRVVSLVLKVFMLVQARSLISSGRLTTGSLVTFFLYQSPISRSLMEILYSYGETVSTVQVISKVFGYLDGVSECDKDGELAPEKLEGSIVFQNVTFTYPSSLADKPALKSLSLEIQAGKMTALVGPSGSGKTTCISLLKRLYKPQEGMILLGGKPLHQYKHKYLHQKVVLVSQNLELFSGSLRYNIEYGLKDCPIDKVREAAKTATADAVFSELTDGYDTDLGGCGNSLSTGQQHCIALIRALVRDPQIIILDETTGKVDAKVWHAVLQKVLSAGGTVLVVAHNLKSVETADRIIFIRNGEVVEEGTHHELMAKRGRYNEFSQNRDYNS
uniref:Uncharacterized protein n=1 Tax=Mola mola TaxID=94237 RepID=A0A3Q3VWF3_MOLML